MCHNLNLDVFHVMIHQPYGGVHCLLVEHMRQCHPSAIKTKANRILTFRGRTDAKVKLGVLKLK